MYQKAIKNFNWYKRKILLKSLHFKGSLQSNLVSAYWYRGIPNFGDQLNIDLLKYYGLTPFHQPRHSAELLVIGSILDKVPEDYSGIIAGSGLIENVSRRFPNAKIYAVRGKLTRDLIYAPKSVPMGDPGLLISNIFKKRYKKKYVLGLIPHYVDDKDIRLQQIYNHNPDDVVIIDVRRTPKDVFKNIDQCQFILSSSLHGIITADSLGIPTGWIILSNQVLGKGFKFFDYASAIEKNISPNYITGNESLSYLISLTHINNGSLIEIQSKLDQVFITLSKEIIESQKHNVK